MIKMRKFSVLSFFLSLLIFSICAIAHPSQARASSNLDGVTWDGTVAIVSKVLDGQSLATELRSQAECPTEVHFESTSGLNGDLMRLFNLNDAYSENNISAITFAQGFTMQNVTRMQSMFEQCELLTSLDVSSFDTSGVTNMAAMFLNCSNLTSLDLSNFNTSQVQEMGQMFQNCSSLEELNILSFDTSNVTNFMFMFWSCEKLTSLILPKTFVATGTKDDPLQGTSGLFANCISLTYIDFGGLTTEASDGSYMDNMFLVAFAILSKDLNISGFLENFSTIVCNDGCLFKASDLSDFSNPGGTYFNYPAKNDKGWNAYNKNYELVGEGMTTEAEFEACQTAHPGTLTYVWADGPQPEPPSPDPDPEPTPDPTPEPEPEPTPSLEDGWLQDDAGWRYVQDGYFVTGWHWIDDAYGAHWYCFSESDNYMIANAWLWDGAWYWVCSTGPMIQGLWQWIDGAWYGFWWNGQMCQGWVWDAGCSAWFYCYADGVVASNTWVDDCWLNVSGVWVH